MSNVAVKGNTSGTGTFTIAAPNSNNDRQFDLPDEAGTVLTSASDIEPQVKDSLNATGSAPIYACRAWVNFNGTGTVAIRDSENVSSINDNGTGTYGIFFQTAMPDNDFSVSASAGIEEVAPFEQENFGRIATLRADDSQGNLTTSFFQLATVTASTLGKTDCETVTAAVFR